MKVKWTSPSNIALVKYWGKFGNQLPQNPSISFTLKRSLTELSISALLKDEHDQNISLDFYFEGIINLKFKEKILKFLESQINQFPWLLNYHLEIQSSNTFPHSSGIASSASSMSALSLCLVSLNELIEGHKLPEFEFFQLASTISRLASGSASRSIFPGLASWGESESIEGSSNLFAQQFSNIHPIFQDYCDSIIIVDAGEKSVSSRVGHSLMENHPFKEQRFNMARENLNRLVIALQSGDLESFIEIVEEEALVLHSLMMTSRPSYILLKPQSLRLIEAIKEFRKNQNIPVCFTIDAGPNIHLLYPKAYSSRVHAWLNKEFSDLMVIHDEVGPGPKYIEEEK